MVATTDLRKYAGTILFSVINLSNEKIICAPKSYCYFYSIKINHELSCGGQQCDLSVISSQTYLPS